MPSSLAAVAECFFSSSLNLIEVVFDLLFGLLEILVMCSFGKKPSKRVGVNENNCIKVLLW
jgi:hypothetical protein